MSPARKWLSTARSGSAEPRLEGPATQHKSRSRFGDFLSSADIRQNPSDPSHLAETRRDSRTTRLIRLSGSLVLCGIGIALGLGNATLTAAVLDTATLCFTLDPATGSYEILDKRAGITWKSNPYRARFGEAVLLEETKSPRVDLARCTVSEDTNSLTATFKPVPARPAADLRVRIRSVDGGEALEFDYEADPALKLESIRLLDEGLWTTDAANGYAVVPVRLGLLVPADSGKSFTRRFDTFAYEGCHMEMTGAVRDGTAALLTWHDPYIAVDLRSTVTNTPWLQGKQVLSTSLTLRKSARSFRLHLLGKGDYGTMASIYRQVAKTKGWLVTWADKLKSHPDGTKYFGASNYKLWSMLSRQMNEDSSKEVSQQVNWTFEEAALVAEHLKRDLKLDRVLFIMGGWIRRGYDNQHPDILPTAPECGGDQAFRDACSRIRSLGYLLSLHDNYQDIYRDSPSYNEDYIMRNAEGHLHFGGAWAGGKCYLTCSRKAVELARRPQNLVAVKNLSNADSYFIDTTYAAGLYECFDRAHPLTRWDDMKWKQAISDYAREVFGTFGSECGREWAIPHAEFFEGITGVSGAYYHDKNLLTQMGASVIPLFEMVYRDCVQMYGKYGYDPARAAEYVLHHIAIGRPLNYHIIPPHLYWKAGTSTEKGGLAVRPAVAQVTRTAPARFSIAYRWHVEQTPSSDWRVFVHFTDAAGNIKFQDDHDPALPTSKWAKGTVEQGPSEVTVPEGLLGNFDIQMGLFSPSQGSRASLAGKPDGDRRLHVGKLRITPAEIRFEPVSDLPSAHGLDAGVFTRGDGGWTDRLHPVDRFVKNTHEVLSPLNEITSQLRLTRHAFLTPDRKVQRTVFGDGAAAVEAVVNTGSSPYRCRSKTGGDVLLPPFGFLVESGAFVAFCALEWNGHRYDAPTLFTLRAQDGQSLDRSASVRAYHGFGDARLPFGGRVVSVPREEVLSH